MKRVYLCLAIALLVVSSATAASARPTETAAQRRTRVALWNAAYQRNQVKVWQAAVRRHQIKVWNAAVRRHQIELWNAAVRRYQIELWNATVLWNKVAAQQATPKPAAARGACGGDLPPCYVMMRESGGSLTARNPSSTASGKWQFLDSTWANFGGYRRAYLAPESVQDARARQLWDHGRGCSHWSAC